MTIALLTAHLSLAAVPPLSSSILVEATGPREITVTGVLWATYAPSPPVTVAISWVAPTGDTGRLVRLFTTPPVGDWNASETFTVPQAGRYEVSVEVLWNGGFRRRTLWVVVQ